MERLWPKPKQRLLLHSPPYNPSYPLVTNYSSCICNHYLWYQGWWNRRKMCWADRRVPRNRHYSQNSWEGGREKLIMKRTENNKKKWARTALRSSMLFCNVLLHFQLRSMFSNEKQTLSLNYSTPMEKVFQHLQKTLFKKHYSGRVIQHQWTDW